MSTARLKPGAIYPKKIATSSARRGFRPTDPGPTGLGLFPDALVTGWLPFPKKTFRSEIANWAGTGFIGGLILESVHDPSAA